MAQPHTLLAKALATLTEEEQGQVLQALMPAPTLGTQQPGWVGAATASMAGLALGSKRRVTASEGVPTVFQAGSADQASLLVRLPVPLHADLKVWSEANGHSMNMVVRGLLEQFLERQQPRQDAG